MAWPLTWEIGTASWRQGVWTSLALDSGANAHISYMDAGALVLAYSRFDGRTFQTEVVDSQRGTGYYSSVALDSHDHPRISYGYNPFGTINNLRYARFDGTAWQIETVDPQGGGYTSIAIDAQDRPHISYSDGFNGLLKYAHFDGIAWQIETVEVRASPPRVGDTSLKLDAQGHPHIAYGGQRQLRYAVFDGTAWRLETVDDLGFGGLVSGVSLVLDPQGQPHIGYVSSRGLKYARKEETIWRIEVVPVSSAGYAALGLDPAGHPLIAFQDLEIQTMAVRLRLARFDGLTWQIATLDSGAVGAYLSLQVDPQGRVHISYYDDWWLRVKYARGTPEVTLDLRLNQSSFRMGEALTLGVTVTPGPVPPTADAYVAVALPDGALLFLQGDGSLTRDVLPFVRDWPVSAVSGTLFQYTFGGGQPPGSYTWFAAFTRPGTLTLIEPLVALPFTFGVRSWRAPLQDRSPSCSPTSSSSITTSPG